MDLYKIEVIKDMQNVINNGNYELTTYTSYDNTFLTEFNAINSCGMRFNFSTTPPRVAELVIHDPAIGKKFYTEWKQTAPGKFLRHDWRYETKDIFGNIPYITISYTRPNGAKMKAIIRDLIEYYNEALTEEERKEYKQKYANITINHHYYSVIKIWSDKVGYTPVSVESFGTSFDDSLKVDIEDTHMQDLGTDNPEESNEDIENISETLF